ncbi:hypothetical protein AAVH_18529 [Aphelenchoides avenae]|nr:hypothetical protein AAVH_18529 [Aphelenchus avenae]
MGHAQSKPEDATRLQRFYADQTADQVELQNLLYERRRVEELSWRRELLTFETMAAATVTVTCAVACVLSRNRFMIVPIVPVAIGAAYRYEELLADNTMAVRKRASEIFEKERDQIRLPGGPITLEEIDRRRTAWKAKQADSS